MLTGEAFSYPVPSCCKYNKLIKEVKILDKIINGEVFKSISVPGYYVSCRGEVYSTISNKILKSFTTPFGH